jgi:hypothetical protein
MQKCVNVRAAREEKLHRRRVVITEGIARDGSVEHLEVVVTLSHQVDDAEVSCVPLLEESVNLVGWIPKVALETRRGVSHCDDARCDVGKVKIEASFLKSPLVERNSLAGELGDAKMHSGTPALVVTHKVPSFAVVRKVGEERCV